MDLITYKIRVFDPAVAGHIQSSKPRYSWNFTMDTMGCFGVMGCIKKHDMHGKLLYLDNVTSIKQLAKCGPVLYFTIEAITLGSKAGQQAKPLKCNIAVL